MVTLKKAKKAVSQKKVAAKSKAKIVAKKNVEEISFTLQRLMNEHPCSDGLIDALEYLRSKRSVQAPRKLWSLVDKLRNIDYYRAPANTEKDIRREIRKIADDVKIIVKPRVFAERLIEGDEFLEYVEKLIKARAMKAFKKRAYEHVKDDLATDIVDESIENIEHGIKSNRDKIKQLEEQIRSHRRAIRAMRSSLRLDERELAELKRRKDTGEKVSEYLPIDEFDPIDVIQDEYNCHELPREKRFLVAEEMARALAI